MARHKRPVCLNLSPAGVDALADLARRAQTNKSDLVNRLLLREASQAPNQ